MASFPNPNHSWNTTTGSLTDLLCTIMVLCCGHFENGKTFWCYLCIIPSRAKAFRDARDNGTLVLEEHGTIIEWGEGHEPGEEVKERMRRHYGMREDFEEQLLALIAKEEH